MAKPKLSIADRIEDEFLFFKTWATSPLKMGADTPTSLALADLMVEHAAPDPAGWVLELGPGTGAVTEALVRAGIPAERIVSVEYDKDFCRLLRERFPAAHIIHGDARDLDAVLGEGRGTESAAVRSAVPLLARPKGKRVPSLEDLLDRLVPGGNVTQLSYSFTPPQDAVPGRFTVEKSKWVTANLPPGRVWIYRRPGNHPLPRG